MAPQGAYRWLRKLLGSGLIWPALLLALLGPQAAPATEIYYLKDTTFLVPFTISTAQQQFIRQVYLYYSDNEGKDYKFAQQAKPSDTSFRFTAPHVGWFFFVVQAEYNDGRRVPNDPHQVQPGLKISVDTTPPVVDLRQIPPPEGTLGIQWDIKDDNLDVLTLRISYRAVGAASFIPLNILQSPLGRTGWTPSSAAPEYDVYLYVSDRAGNPASRYLRVKPGQTQSVASPVPQPPPPPSRAQMVNTKSLRLNYDLADVGKSNVSKIQVWATQDTQTWKLLKEEPTSSSSSAIQVQVDKDGRWGFKLIAKSGVGKGEPPPERGAQPDFWVEIDEIKPTVQIKSAEPSGTPENGLITIKWTADDKHLADRPITISYADVVSQQWTIIANGLSNDGVYVWAIPPGLEHHQVLLKVEAADQAGNIGSDQTKAPVITDLSIPKVRIKNVEGAGQSSAMPGSSYAPGIMNPSNPIQPVSVEAVVAPAPQPNTSSLPVGGVTPAPAASVGPGVQNSVQTPQPVLAPPTSTVTPLPLAPR